MKVMTGSTKSLKKMPQTHPTPLFASTMGKSKTVKSQEIEHRRETSGGISLQ